MFHYYVVISFLGDNPLNQCQECTILELSLIGLRELLTRLSMDKYQNKHNKTKVKEKESSGEKNVI